MSEMTYFAIIDAQWELEALLRDAPRSREEDILRRERIKELCHQVGAMNAEEAFAKLKQAARDMRSRTISAPHGTTQSWTKKN